MFGRQCIELPNPRLIFVARKLECSNWMGWVVFSSREIGLINLETQEVRVGYISPERKFRCSF